MTNKQSGTALATLLMLTTAMTVGLQQLDAGYQITWSDPVGWFGEASLESAIAASLRIVGLVLGYWVIVSTTLYSLAFRRRPRLVARVTLPLVRRLVDRTMATALAGSIALSPVIPSPVNDAPPPPIVFDIASDGVPVPHVRITQPIEEASASTEPVDIEADRPAATIPITRPVAIGGATGADGRYTVVPGDSLWAIAAAQVENGNDIAAVSSYWRQVVATNQDTLRSGDPNLIYPGEIVTLPAVAP